MTPLEARYQDLEKCLREKSSAQRAKREPLYSFVVFNGAHDAHTPRALCKEILSSIDLSNRTILVLFNIEFVWSLVIDFGIDPGYITFYSDHPNKDKYVNYVGVKSIISNLQAAMKFDIIVGNPPFQRNNTDAKRWTLWEQFVKKSFDLADTVAMVTPQSITSPGPFEMIKDRATVINIDVSKHFTVSSTFSYFIAHNQTNTGTAKLITDSGEFEQDLKNVDFLPFVITKETLEQINWLKQRNSRTWKRGELHTSNKELFDANGKYNVIHTNAQTLKTNIEHTNLSKYRVCITLSGYAKFTVIHNAYCSQATMWTEFNTIEEAQAFADECNGPYIQNIMKIFKWSGWNSKEVIEHL